ncbi:MAG: hypothetical protein KatS3mg115_1563 [Candidatus Poribacteria bacterium]|nr:MAG: hypothetical protein KatS3mg115_1563 [Candidatus Poribacteria bacterium]
MPVTSRGAVNLLDQLAATKPERVGTDLRHASTEPVGRFAGVLDDVRARQGLSAPPSAAENDSLAESSGAQQAPEAEVARFSVPSKGSLSESPSPEGGPVEEGEGGLLSSGSGGSEQRRLSDSPLGLGGLSLSASLPKASPAEAPPDGEGFSQASGLVPGSGKDFPSAGGGLENISTDRLLQALEREILAQGSRSGATTGQTPAELRFRTLTAAVPARSAELAPSALLRQGLVQRLEGMGRSVALGTPDEGSSSGGGVGTLRALHQLRATESGSRAWARLAGQAGDTVSAGRVSSPASGSGRPVGLEGARWALRRRAAQAAFGGQTRTEGLPRPLEAATGGGRPILSGPRSPEERGGREPPSLVRQRRAISEPSGEGWRAWVPREEIRPYEPSHAGAAATPTPSSAGSAGSAQTTTVQQAYSPLMQMLAQEVRRQVRTGKREFRIRLEPEALGSVEMEVSIQEGELVVRLKAASPESQKLMEAHLDELEAALAEHGMRLDVELPWRLRSSNRR